MFIDVEENAQRQERLFAGRKSALIEDYYPELHDKQSEPFTCTICSHLIPDLMTRRRILIDLDNLRTEADLIHRFGVDKAFLMKLQQRKLVIVATNLDPDQHKNNTWMHDILANQDTIFKSNRTPHFFRARFPDIEDVQRDYQIYIKSRFEKLSTQDYEFLISHMDVVPQNAPRSGAANKLAWDIARVEAMLREDSTIGPSFTPDDILERPHPTLGLLYRDKMLAVSPHTGALGGSMLVPYQLMKRLFPHVPPNEHLREKLVSHEEIMSYLARVSLEVEPADLTCAKYWSRITFYQREKLLDDLQQDGERGARAEAERNLRARISRGHPDVSLDEIKHFVEADIAWVKRYEKICSLGYNSANFWFMMFVGEFAYWLGAASFMAGQLLKDRAKKLLEFAAPRIQVANFVRSRTRR